MPVMESKLSPEPVTNGEVPSQPEVETKQGTMSICYFKHLMTAPKENSEFCFSEALGVSRGEAEGNIEVEGRQNSLFPAGPVIKCFVILSNSTRKHCKEIVCFMPAGS